MRFISQVCSGLRFRLLVLVLLTCAPLAALTLHTASEDRRRERASWSQRPQKLIQLAGREEVRVIGQTRQLLLAISESGAVRSGNWQGCHRLLAELFSAYPNYANLGVIRTNGEVLASAVPMADAENQAERKFFRRAVESRAFAIGGYPSGHTNGRPTVTFGCPVIDRFGQLQAVAFAALDLNWIARSASEVAAQVPRTASVVEIDENGTILGRYPSPGSGTNPPALNRSLVKGVLSEPRGLLEAPDAKGVATVYAYGSRPSQLMAGKVAVILSIPRRVLFATADRLLWRNLMWLGAAAGLALALGWVGGSFLVLRPVKALLRSTTRLGSGDLTARTGLPHGRDELGQLTRAFDQMAQALEQRELERRRAEETLETRDRMIRELPVLPAAVYVCDPAGAIELYNRTAVELWGYEPSDHYAGKRFCGSHRLLHPDGTPLPHDESPMAEVLRTGNPVHNRELVIERPDGSKVSVLANVVPLRDPDGVVIGAVNCLQDISDRKAAEERLKESNEELQFLSRRLVESQETERRHIARELHDEVGQSLTVAEMNLQAMLRSPRAAALMLPLKETMQAVERVLEQVHDLSLSLRPAMLDDLGLEPALRWYTNRQASLAGLTAEFHAEPLEQRLDPVVETACFRVAQEALTNVVRHAKAQALTVNLTKKNGHLHLSVRDDGVGFNVADLREQAARGASLGLLSMEERAVLADGGFECISVPGQGTEIRAWFPFKLRADE
jgi:PAS domain S-box-containing protein